MGQGEPEIRPRLIPAKEARKSGDRQWMEGSLAEVVRARRLALGLRLGSPSAPLDPTGRAGRGWSAEAVARKKRNQEPNQRVGSEALNG